MTALMRSLKKYKTYDEKRPGLPGEHWLVFGAGIVLLLASGRSSSPIKRAVGSAVGSALLYRAASGRDGVAKLLRYLPPSKGLLRR